MNRVKKDMREKDVSGEMIYDRPEWKVTICVDPAYWDKGKKKTKKSYWRLCQMSRWSSSSQRSPSHADSVN